MMSEDAANAAETGSTDSAIKRLLLMEAMAGLGTSVELDFRISEEALKVELNKLTDEWRPYNPRKEISRHGLSLTSLDGEMTGVPDLDSLLEYNRLNNTRFDEADFTQPTRALQELRSLAAVLDPFAPYLGRS